MTVPSAARILERCDALARCSEQPDGLTRVYLSPQQRAASTLVLQWMTEAGMNARLDAVGNVVGRYEGERAGLPCLLLGSHLDTVRDAGKYDGMLGVVTAIECVAALHEQRRRLPFAIDVIGFADEEGVRFNVTLLGSRAVAGSFDRTYLERTDRDGLAMRDAMRGFGLDPDSIDNAARRRAELLAYAELHIEQGPVLEQEGLPVGVVTAINGGNRLAIELTGMAGHAGTVPMHLRRDALTAAAECVLAVERIASGDRDLVGTVGKIEAAPGAINVIPGRVRFSVDVRAPTDVLRERALAAIRSAIADIAGRRKVALDIQPVWDAKTTPCAPWLQEQIAAAVAGEAVAPRRLPSGAGHDGMAISAITDIGMLFVRCRGGISHNPAEAISEEDAGVAARVFLRFIENFRPQR
ncbi:MAG TPA: allantoate amidohydrolase [Casimicrobiaceae bacterium]|jgi:allantoate deiminase|nr:allantoate amidohydrolase [Casimicrobiaceae bacterium]